MAQQSHHGIRIDEATWLRAKAIAKHEDRSVASLIEIVLRDYLTLKEYEIVRHQRYVEKNRKLALDTD